jgi:hypothetical protein
VVVTTQARICKLLSRLGPPCCNLHKLHVCSHRATWCDWPNRVIWCDWPNRVIWCDWPNGAFKMGFEMDRVMQCAGKSDAVTVCVPCRC